jgi:hypothetical protein
MLMPPIFIPVALDMAAVVVDVAIGMSIPCISMLAGVLK